MLSLLLLAPLAGPPFVPPPATIDFARDVVPLLTRHGCNSGGCHGKASGQNGFKLSLLGFDTDFDYRALVNEARGRRLFPSSPEQSLLLTKAAATVPHGGGRRMARGSEAYGLLLGWIQQGAKPADPTSPPLRSLEVLPGTRVMARSSAQAMTVVAHYADG